jgi:hypothetical protein
MHKPTLSRKNLYGVNIFLYILKYCSRARSSIVALLDPWLQISSLLCSSSSGKKGCTRNVAIRKPMPGVNFTDLQILFFFFVAIYADSMPPLG